MYKLHRETYHLAQDYFDRFMATQTNVFKSSLQLIGITCLFIAAKVEVRSEGGGATSDGERRSLMSRLSRLLQEMYPPKVHQFAYVTDDACTEDEILSMEVIIMQVQKVFLGVWKGPSENLVLAVLDSRLIPFGCCRS